MSTENNNTPDFAEMSKEELVALVTQQTTTMGAYQDRVTTQLQQQYESAPEYIRNQIPLDEFTTDPMAGLVRLEQLQAVYSEIKADVLKGAPAKPDPTSASPGNSTSKGGGVSPILTFADAAAFIKKARE